MIMVMRLMINVKYLCRVRHWQWDTESWQWGRGSSENTNCEH